jgi:hypothetical protein
MNHGFDIRIGQTKPNKKEGMRHYGYFVCNYNEVEPWVMICCAEEFMAEYFSEKDFNTLYWIELDRNATKKFLESNLHKNFKNMKTHPRDDMQIIIPVQEEEISSPVLIAERVLKIASIAL